MNANEIRNLNWVTVSDWSDLTMTAPGFDGPLVGESDVNNFVENTFREVARKLRLPYEEVAPILKEENSSFYALKENFFMRQAFTSKRNEVFLEVQKMLKIPDVPKIIYKSNVERILADFSALTDDEKLEVFEVLKASYTK